MVFIDDEVFTSVSSVNFNNVFTSTYAHYFMTFDYVSSTDDAVRVRLRASGTNNTTSNYYTQRINGNDTSLTGIRKSATTEWDLTDASTLGNGGFATIFNPQTSIKTGMLSKGFYNGTSIWLMEIGNFFNATTSFDGISIIAASGTITGTIRIYGLANS
jgi:hypothetical protein